MALEPIPEEKYAAFAERQFLKNDKMLESGVVHEVYHRFRGVTSALQRIMNVLYLNTECGATCTVGMVDAAINYILDLNNEYYKTLFSQMSERQRNVFVAIASEGRVKEISSGNFIAKYRLSTASSVVSAVKGLLAKDFLTKEGNEYMVYDHFFQLWLEQSGYLVKSVLG